MTASVMISEVLFGYFLFKEKVTDAPLHEQDASHFPADHPLSYHLNLSDNSSVAEKQAEKFTRRRKEERIKVGLSALLTLSLA
jgi:hypothetical protein